uniref:Uncharacterized protein n=1 Tax=Panagrolaimus sp. PS1159 TaxID=55785 RepID=A0AC35F138_9BILA
MTTINDYLLSLKSKHGTFTTYPSNGNQYNNLNLNQNHQFSTNSFFKTSKNVTIEKRKVSNNDYTNNKDLQKDPHSWKKSALNYENYNSKKEDELKKQNFNSSTLSFHIEAYENSIEANLFDGNKDCKNFLNKQRKNLKQICIESVIQNPFEFPRQQQENDDEEKVPEISEFKASQCLINPNQMNQRLSDSNEQVCC